MRLDKILVPLDGSDVAEAALETAVDFLKGQATAQLVLLRAAEASTTEGYLDAVVARLRESGVNDRRDRRA
jgi:nucleotide-binding universal stress UspA family protein